MGLTVQQHLGFLAAVKAAATAPSASNPLVFGNDQPWEEVTGVVREKSGFGSAGCRLGEGNTTRTISAYADFTGAEANIEYVGGAWKNKTNGTSSTPFNYGNFQTSSSNPYAVVESTIYTGAYAGWKAWDGSIGTESYWWSGSQASPWYNGLTGAPAKTAYEYYLYSQDGAGDAENPYSWQFQVWNGAWTTVDTRTNEALPTGWSSAFTIASPIEGTGFRLYITAREGGGSGTIKVREIDVRVYSAATTSNTVQTISLGSFGLLPSTLAPLDESSVEITTAGKLNVAYSLNGGSTFSSLVDLLDFKALAASTFDSSTDIRLKLQPVGTQQLKSLTVQLRAPNAGTIRMKDGSVGLSFGGETVIELQSDGDAVFADISADNITMTGDLTLDTVTRTVAQGTTTNATPTVIKSIAVAADKICKLRAKITGNVASTANKGTYLLSATFYRNGSGNVTQLGDIVSLDTDEADTDWDATLVANTGSQTVDLQVTGKAATTIAWSAAIEYNLV